MTHDPATQPTPTTDVAQLRSFLDGIEAKSPEEVLGLPSTNQLPMLTVGSAVATVLLLLVATGASYVFGVGTTRKKEPVATTKPAAPTTENTPDTIEATADSDATANATNDEPGANTAKAIDAMGIGETKTADPDKNPLESELDNILNGIE